MSYILEALKKSELERQRGAAPTLRATQAAVARPPRDAIWFSAVLALVLISAGIVIGWWRPWQSDKPVAARVSAAPTPAPDLIVVKPSELSPPAIALAPPVAAPSPTATPTPTIAIRPAAPPEVAHNAARGPTKTEAKANPPVPLAAALAPAPVPPNIAAVAPIDALPGPRRADPAAPATPAVSLPALPAAPVAAITPDASRSSAPQQATLPRRSDLPPAIRQEIPPLAISVHFYSGQRENSLVSINGRSLREGEEIAPDLKVERITPEGVIFAFKGYQFFDAVAH
jgi:general secretion pathway protein B